MYRQSGNTKNIQSNPSQSDPILSYPIRSDTIQFILFSFTETGHTFKDVLAFCVLAGDAPFPRAVACVPLQPELPFPATKDPK